MTVTVNVNKLSIVHKGSEGVSSATLPDVCKTPPAPVPVPYSNVSFSSDLAKGTVTVRADGGNSIAHRASEFSKSTGDERGSAGGVASGTFTAESTWITFSFDVKVEGKNACRLTDKKFQNHGNTVNMAGEIQRALRLSTRDFKKKCADCKAHGDEKIKWARKMQDEYRRAAANPMNRWAQQIEKAVDDSLAAQGIKTVVAGTTDSKGKITIKKPRPGPCAELDKMSTMKHEKVHQRDRNALATRYKEDTPEFLFALWEGKRWAQSDIDAYGANAEFWEKFNAECKALGV